MKKIRSIILVITNIMNIMTDIILHGEEPDETGYARWSRKYRQIGIHRWREGGTEEIIEIFFRKSLKNRK